MIQNSEIGMWKMILRAGLAGGMAEILWITSYSGVTTVDGAMVARQITASFWPAAAEWAFAPALGVIIHLVLSIALVAMAVPLLSRFSAKNSSAGFVVGSTIFALAFVWTVNFFIVLPLVNPTFITLMPYSITLTSKLLFGVTMGLVLYNVPPTGARAALICTPQ